MDMDKQTDQTLLSQGDRTSRDLALQSIVPASASSGEHCASRSCHGLPGELPTSSHGEAVIADEQMTESFEGSEDGQEYGTRTNVKWEKDTSSSSFGKKNALRFSSSRFNKTRRVGPASYKKRLQAVVELMPAREEPLINLKDKSTFNKKDEESMDCDTDIDGGEDPSELNTEATLAAKEKKVEEAEANLKLKEKRGRGRPPTTGQFVGRDKARRSLIEAQNELADCRLNMLAVDKLNKANTYLKCRDAETEDVPTRDLTSSISESLDAVLSVTKISKGLKGTAVRTLKDAVALIEASAEKLVARAYGHNTGAPRDGEDKMLKDLEARLKKLEGRNAELMKENERLRNRQVQEQSTYEPPKEQRPARVVKTKRKAKGALDLSEEEDGLDIRTEETADTEDRVPKWVGRIVEKLESMMNGKMMEMERRLNLLRTELTGKGPVGKEIPVKEMMLGYLPAHLPGANPIGANQMETEEYHTLDPWEQTRTAETGEPEKEKVGLVPRKEERRKEPEKEKERSNPTRDKQKPRIISDIRLIEPKGYTTKGAEDDKFSRIANRLGKIQTEVTRPTPNSLPREEKWSEVVKRKGGKKKAAAQQDGKVRVNREKEKPNNQRKTKRMQQRKTRRLPKTEAITIVCPEGTYEDVMEEATSKINLAEFDILEGVKQRTTRTGAISIQISGDNNKEKADKLSEKLKVTLADREGVRISRPVIKSDLLITRLNHTIKVSSIAAAIAKVGNCPVEEVKVNPTKMNPATRMGTAWVRCPAKVANGIIAAKGLTVGWAKVGAIPLEGRPLQCHRCLSGGHVWKECTSDKDRSNRCYRCGEENHLARDCTEAPRCPVCSDLKKPADHRMGSKMCTSVRGDARNRRNKASTDKLKSKTGETDKDKSKTKSGDDKPKVGHNIYDVLRRDDDMDATEQPGTSKHASERTLTREETEANREQEPKTESQDTERLSSSQIEVVDLEEEERMNVDWVKFSRPAPPSSPGGGSSPVMKRVRANNAKRKIIDSDEEEDGMDATEEAAAGHSEYGD